MPVCKYCGGEIVFRNVDGVPTPIHRSGGCWGEAESEPRPESIRFKHEDDLCRPTRCPKCEADVYFIRHNGGSVWIDELGWPWPKHPCFDSTPDIAPLRVLQEAVSRFHGSTGGVVTRVVFVQGSSRCVAEVTKPGAGKELWIVHGIRDPRRLVGALVALSSADKKMVVPGVGTYDIAEPLVQCRVCKTPVLQRQMDQHLAEKHGVVCCPACRTLVSCRAIDAHLRDHERHVCPRGHGALRMWEGVRRCWTCGWPFKRK